MNLTTSKLNDLVYQVTGAAIEVHRALGPGLLENIYSECMQHELSLRGIDFVAEKRVPINFKELKTSTNLRLDLLIENILVIELKSVKEILPIHEAQILSYMKLLNLPKGLIINFNVTNIVKEGQYSFVNQLYYDLPE